MHGYECCKLKVDLQWLQMQDFGEFGSWISVRFYTMTTIKNRRKDVSIESEPAASCKKKDNATTSRKGEAVRRRR